MRDAATTRPSLRGVANAFATDLRERDSPVTAVVVASIVVVFLVQSWTASRLDVPVGTLTGVVFVREPVLAWLLSPFLHRDVGHVVANLVVVALVGRVVEPAFATRDYVAFLLAAGVIAGLGGYLSKAAFTTAPVTAYGASGLAYALAGYALCLPFANAPVDASAHDTSAHDTSTLDASALGVTTLDVTAIVDRTSPSERVAAIVGIAAVATVAVDVATGPYLTFEWLNGAHLVGLLVGIWTAVIHRRVD